MRATPRWIWFSCSRGGSALRDGPAPPARPADVDCSLALLGNTAWLASMHDPGRAVHAARLALGPRPWVAVRRGEGEEEAWAEPWSSAVLPAVAASGLRHLVAALPEAQRIPADLARCPGVDVDAHAAASLCQQALRAGNVHALDKLWSPMTVYHPLVPRALLEVLHRVLWPLLMHRPATVDFLMRGCSGVVKGGCGPRGGDRQRDVTALKQLGVVVFNGLRAVWLLELGGADRCLVGGALREPGVVGGPDAVRAGWVEIAAWSGDERGAARGASAPPGAAYRWEGVVGAAAAAARRHLSPAQAAALCAHVQTFAEARRGKDVGRYVGEMGGHEGVRDAVVAPLLGLVQRMRAGRGDALWHPVPDDVLAVVVNDWLLQCAASF